MGSKSSTRKSLVDIDENGMLSHWVDWLGRAAGCPLAALATGGREPLVFIDNEVLVGASERNLITELESWGASVVPSLPLQPPPAEILRSRRINGARLPVPVRLRFSQAPQVAEPSVRL